jgi:hypothetical protein
MEHGTWNSSQNSLGGVVPSRDCTKRKKDCWEAKTPGSAGCMPISFGSGSRKCRPVLSHVRVIHYFTDAGQISSYRGPSDLLKKREAYADEHVVMMMMMQIGVRVVGRSTYCRSFGQEPIADDAM